ncbi:Ribbon-helix-helix protein, copG family [Streptococcus equi subsp. zooepidemicus Sz12is]|uniref:plasmid mobilization protein n=1 Tax=Streptococcus equi TaxID=1336 RepID=UPI0005BB23B1|nr:ribbon-helix-helix protein, CopG family [Streptococcus equi]KIS05191.1 Ribbon-helix-helix protein, copG family [Streptococcus equi subsp. zooepidemicus Sz12is]
MLARESNILIRVSEKEKKILERKARKSGVSVSEFIRATTIHSDDSQIRLIDVKPLRQFLFELTKQGTNLNQFMKFLHTYGIERLSARHIKELLEDEKKLFERGKNMLLGLQKELEHHHIYLVEEKKNNDDY